jgi:hypothetical protein
MPDDQTRAERELCQKNVNRSGSHTQTSQTLWSTSLVLLNNSICSQAPLELNKELSDSARAFSGARKSMCSCGCAFKMLQYLTYRIVKCWSSHDLFRRYEGDLVPYAHSSGFLEFHNHKAFRPSYSSWFQSQDSFHHNMACIIYLSIYIYTYGQSGCRQYFSVIGGAPGDAN